jgi:fatty-acyl-CoA synthase
MEAWEKKTLGQVLEEVSRRYPENAALIFKDQRISYGELLEKARALAKGLIALGVGRGDKVAIWAGNCPEWVYTQMATALLGAVLVPVNTRFRTTELEYILGQSESTTLVTVDRFLNTDNLGMVKEIAPEMGAGCGSAAIEAPAASKECDPARGEEDAGYLFLHRGDLLRTKDIRSRVGVNR